MGAEENLDQILKRVGPGLIILPGIMICGMGMNQIIKVGMSSVPTYGMLVEDGVMQIVKVDIFLFVRKENSVSFHLQVRVKDKYFKLPGDSKN